jgi:beta-1,4-mannosyltransferase
LRLVVAGECLDEGTRELLVREAERGSVMFIDKFIHDDEVAKYFSACDVVCLPFTRVTGSGSALLALTYGRPIVAPRLGALMDLSDNLGYFYDPSDPEGLRAALESAIHKERPPDGFQEALSTHLATTTWEQIANLTRKVYCAVMH